MYPATELRDDAIDGTLRDIFSLRFLINTHTAWIGMSKHYMLTFKRDGGGQLGVVENDS